MTKQYRILHIVTHMNKGGLERRLMDLYREIDRNKYQFDFLCLSDKEGDFDDEIIELGGKIFYLSYISIRNIKKINNQLISFFESHPEYDIVHCHLNQWSGFILKSAKKANIPIRIAHSRTSLEKNSIKNFIKNIIKLPTNQYSTHKMAVSDKAALWLFGHRIVKNKEVYILPNAIKMSDFIFNSKVREQYRKKLNIEDSIVVMHVGNMKPEKNHKFLINVFSEIKSRVRDAHLVLVGEGSMRCSIESMIEERNLKGHVSILGSREDVNLLLQAGDIFIFPSFYEGFPGSVLEAQVSGMPCIISNTITDEVAITDRIIQLSLKEDAKNWAEKSLFMYYKFKGERLVDNLDLTYDIKSSANDLIKYYKILLEENLIK